MKVRNHKIYTEVVWEWNDASNQLEQISEQTENYSGDLSLAMAATLCDSSNDSIASVPWYTAPLCCLFTAEWGTTGNLTLWEAREGGTRTIEVYDAGQTSAGNECNSIEHVKVDFVHTNTYFPYQDISCCFDFSSDSVNSQVPHLWWGDDDGDLSYIQASGIEGSQEGICNVPGLYATGYPSFTDAVNDGNGCSCQDAGLGISTVPSHMNPPPGYCSPSIYTTAVGDDWVAAGCEDSSLYDVCDVCGGDCSSCQDTYCNGECAVTTDCAGDCGGSASEDCVGTCSNSDSWIGDIGTNGVDDCGDCDGGCFDNTAIIGCCDCPSQLFDCTYPDAGSCGGSLVDDACSVCGGDGSSCAGCDGVSNSLWVDVEYCYPDVDLDEWADSSTPLTGLCRAPGTTCESLGYVTILPGDFEGYAADPGWDDCVSNGDWHSGNNGGLADGLDPCGVCNGDETTCTDCGGAVANSCIPSTGVGCTYGWTSCYLDADEDGIAETSSPTTFCLPVSGGSTNCLDLAPGLTDDAGTSITNYYTGDDPGGSLDPCTPGSGGLSHGDTYYGTTDTCGVCEGDNSTCTDCAGIVTNGCNPESVGGAAAAPCVNKFINCYLDADNDGTAEATSNGSEGQNPFCVPQAHVCGTGISSANITIGYVTADGVTVTHNYVGAPGDDTCLSNVFDYAGACCDSGVLDGSDTCCGAYLDECGVCDGNGSVDCFGAGYGCNAGSFCCPTGAYESFGDCGDVTVCYELDECGVCGGDNSSCADECGVPNGGGIEGACTRHHEDNPSVNAEYGPGIPYLCCDCNLQTNDCAGVCYGDSFVNDCDDCVEEGDTTDLLCIQGCAGDWANNNSETIDDECGVCDGDNSTCLNCNGDVDFGCDDPIGDDSNCAYKTVNYCYADVDADDIADSGAFAQSFCWPAGQTCEDNGYITIEAGDVGSYAWDTCVGDLGCGCISGTPNPAPSGCDVACGSTAVVDDCGVCNGFNASMDCRADDGENVSYCAENGGDWFVDDCGYCNSPDNENQAKDVCGICDHAVSYYCIGGTGDGSILCDHDSDCPGICDGDGSSCAGCDGVSNSLWVDVEYCYPDVDDDDIAENSGVISDLCNPFGTTCESLGHITILPDDFEGYAADPGWDGCTSDPTNPYITQATGLDTCGVCNGDNTTCTDCAGTATLNCTPQSQGGNDSDCTYQNIDCYLDADDDNLYTGSVVSLCELAGVTCENAVEVSSLALGANWITFLSADGFDADDDCFSNYHDCMGVCDGSAFLDDCSDCVGGTSDCTGLTDGDGNYGQSPCVANWRNLGPDDNGDNCGCGSPSPSGCDNICGSSTGIDHCGDCGGSNDASVQRTCYYDSDNLGFWDTEVVTVGICPEGTTNHLTCAEFYAIGENNPTGYAAERMYDDDTGGGGFQINGCMDEDACNTCEDDCNVDDGSCEYRSCCSSAGTTFGSGGGTCTCDGQFGEGNGTTRYCGTTCEYDIDDCGDCADGSGGESGFVVVANANLDVCNVCDGTAVPSVEGNNVGYLPESYYTTCYPSDSLDDTEVTTGTGYYDANGEYAGWRVCDDGADYAVRYVTLLDGDIPVLLLGQYASDPETFGNEHLTCEDYGHQTTIQFDAGCSDASACNYVLTADGCASDGDLSNTTCCIYPRQYCKADGSTYSMEGEFGLALGDDTCCDVLGPAAALTGGTPGAVAESIYYCDGVDVGGVAWTADGLTPSEDNGPAHTYTSGHTPTSADGTTYVEASFYDGFISWVVQSEGGLDTDPACGAWSITGCPDPAALNYGAAGAGILYDVDDTGASISLLDEYPIITCQYCPAGYDFYWSSHYSNLNVTNAKTTGIVIADSIYLTDVSDGACFYTSDVNIVNSLNDSRGTYTATYGETGLSAGLQMHTSQYGGYQTWDSEGKLQEFAASNAYNGNTTQTLNLTSISGISGLTNLLELDVSYNDITGDIPLEIFIMTQLTELYLNNNQFNSITTTDGTTGGICDLISSRGVPGIETGQAYNSTATYDNNDTWLYIHDNAICPTHGVDANLGVAYYPPCLLGDNQTWHDANLGISLVDYHTTYSGVQDVGACMAELAGCTNVNAINYWPEALVAGGSCYLDNYLHFPYDEETEEYGGAMTTVQMIQALHANIYGNEYRYNGSLDVTNSDEITWDESVGTNPGLAASQGFTSFEFDCDLELNPQNIDACTPTFANLSPEGNSIINIYDGLWWRMQGPESDFGLSDACSPSVGIGATCAGDSRPLEFIQRVLNEAGTLQNAYAVYFGSYFPVFGGNMSMHGLEYFEDFDVNGNGQLDESDKSYWRDIGRYDIVEFIDDVNGNMITDNWAPSWAPDSYTGLSIPLSYEPEWVEFWATDTTTSMGYSKDFVSTEIPSGQYQCSDGGDASSCYTNIYSCGLVDQTYLDSIDVDCTPCGTNGDCIPMTIQAAAFGHEKILRVNSKLIKYFTDSTTSTLSGSSIYTASMADTNKKYYYGVTDGNPDSSGIDTQFYVTWGHIYGSGSVTSLSESNDKKGASEAVYKQYASMLLDDNQIQNGFLISSGSDIQNGGTDGEIDEWIYVLNFKQTAFKDAVNPSSWTLQLSGSHNGVGKTISLTDNGLLLANSQKVINDAGRRFDIISGSAGSSHTNYVVNGGRYGFFYPDAGLMVFGEKLSNEFKSIGSPEVGEFNSASAGNNQIYPLTSSNSDAKNALRFVNTMRNVRGTTLILNGEKESTNVIYACRLGVSDFNHTNNFSILSGSARNIFSDDIGVRDGFFISASYTGYDDVSYLSGSSTMDGDPHTFITQVHLWNNYGIPVATATLSKPMMKNFAREVVIKVKLEF